MSFDFGVEIEFIAPRGVTKESLATSLSAAGVDTFATNFQNWKTTSMTRWKTVHDGSVMPNGIEVVSPPFIGNDAAERGFEAIRKVCAHLNTIGGQVNRSCGLHVHIGARRLSVPALKKLAALYIENETVIDKLLPPSRRGNAGNYCQSLKSRANIGALVRAQRHSDVVNAVGNFKYVKLNFTSFYKGTVEFRHHSGTIDAEKITKWIIFCSKMVETAEREADQPIALADTNPSRRPRGRMISIIYDLISRPQGASQAEIRTALGTTRNIAVGYRLQSSGIPYRLQRRRYYLGAAEAALPASHPTVELLVDRIGLEPADREFWLARERFLSSAAGMTAAE
jgi:hypothetical protein